MSIEAEKIAAFGCAFRSKGQLVEAQNEIAATPVDFLQIITITSRNRWNLESFCSTALRSGITHQGHGLFCPVSTYII